MLVQGRLCLQAQTSIRAEILVIANNVSVKRESLTRKVTW